MLRAAALVLAVTSCVDTAERPPFAPADDRCERVAARLLPPPLDPDFLATCRARLHTPGYGGMLDCVLAIPGEIYDDAQVAPCQATYNLPVYFQF